MGIMSLVGNILGGSDAKRFARADEASVILGEKEKQAQDYYKMVTDKDEATRKTAINDLKSLKALEIKEFDLGSEIANTQAVKNAFASYNQATGQNIDFSTNELFKLQIGKEANRSGDKEEYAKNLIKSLAMDAKGGQNRYGKFFDGTVEAEQKAKTDAQQQRSQQLLESSKSNFGERLTNIFNRKGAYEKQISRDRSNIDPKVREQMRKIGQGEPASSRQESLTTKFVNLTTNEQLGLNKKAGILIASNNNSVPQLDPSQSEVVNFTGGNKEEISTARVTLELVNLMSDAEYNFDEESRLYKDAQALVSAANVNASKSEGYEENKEKTFDLKITEIKQQLSQLKPLEKVDYINKLKKEGMTGSNKVIYDAKTKELAQKLGNKKVSEATEFVIGLVDSGEAKSLGDNKYIVTFPEKDIAFEFELDKGKVIDYKQTKANSRGSKNVNADEARRILSNKPKKLSKEEEFEKRHQLQKKEEQRKKNKEINAALFN
tara:strand:- start:340 stop:1815 length:1476 start_codon:yes stop_codon:yes gene_type:complete